jgi:hypothetical protein
MLMGILSLKKPLAKLAKDAETNDLFASFASFARGS